MNTHLLKTKQFAVIIICMFLSNLSLAESANKSVSEEISETTSESSVTYIGNEGILFSNGEQKALFDPFFHNVYGQYQAVPKEIQTAIFANTPPYDDIDVIVVSHSHGDHFTAETVADYLSKYSNAVLVAPSQATDQVLEHSPELIEQIRSLELDFGDTVITTEVEGIEIQSVRIPHAGWPERAEIANLVHRVSLDNGTTIIHMGDADPRDEHFAPFAAHWNEKNSNAAFPPYWFFISPEGPTILGDRINANDAIGIHVPVEVPQDLKDTGAKYFSEPGIKKVLP